MWTLIRSGLSLDESMAVVMGQYPDWVREALIEQWNAEKDREAGTEGTDDVGDAADYVGSAEEMFG